MAAACWVARPEEADTVARLLVAFRDHMGKEWPSANAFLASVERLLDDRATDFLLATPDEESPPGGVAQLRYRWSVWTAADDCWLRSCSWPARHAGTASARPCSPPRWREHASAAAGASSSTSTRPMPPPGSSTRRTAS